MAWEAVALELARRARIDVPHSRLLDLAGRHVLVVDRFDRTRDGSRIGYVSAMTMLEASDGDRRSYLEIAEVIEVTSARAGRDLAELWRRVVFSVLISNTDDHLRNHGFLHSGGTSWSLAPAFDLNPEPEPGPRYLSTTIDMGDDEASIDLAMSVAPMFRLSGPAARTVLHEVAAAVRTWRDVARQWLGPEEVERMAPAFDALREVPPRA